MAKLYFKYGSMGSSKTAQALITKYNYEENGMLVWLIKPAADSRDGEVVLRSRVGLEAIAEVVSPAADICELFRERSRTDVIIADECQFLTSAQIDQLRRIVDDANIPVLCFGLRTDFQSICDCGAKATTNARLDADGYVVTEGAQLLLGGNDRYIAMCHKCWVRNIREHRKVK